MSEQHVHDRPTFWAAGRHPVNVGHLVMGLAFLGLVGIWALFVSGTVEGSDLRWLMPVPWIVAGAVGLVATTFGSARRERWDDDRSYDGQVGERLTGWQEPRG